MAGRPWLRGLAWLLCLGPFFYLTYGFANAITAARSNVPAVVFDWERHIPFLAWTIVPYWSTNLLYSISLFVCRTRQELDTHSGRLVAVQLIAVAGFLVFPLRFTFEQPETSGFFGWLFDVLMGFDKPFNQAPSLHLSISVVLWVLYSGHLNGVARLAMQAWLVLSSFSTLTTYQHHFVDLPTGVLAGMIGVGLFPRDASLTTRLASAYALGSLLLGSTAFRIQSIAWILLWPAAALAWVSLAYWRQNPFLLGKSSHGMRPAMQLFLLPFITAMWLNSRLWTRGQPSAHQVASGVWIGRAPLSANEAARFRSIVDLTAELPVAHTGVKYVAVPALDLVAPDAAQLRSAAKAIEAFADARPTLVCCALGYSRSAAATAAWLLTTGRADSVAEAIAQIKGCRPHCVIHARHVDCLAELVAP